MDNQTGQDEEYNILSQFLNPYSITLFIKLRFQKKLLFVRDTSKKKILNGLQ